MGIESIVVTTEQDRVNREYPDYIDRQQIYTLWLQTSQPNEKFEDNINCANAKKQYLRLIDFIQTQTYKSSIVPSAPSTDSEYSTTQQSPKEYSGCNLFARWFGKRTATQASETQTSSQNAVTTNNNTNAALLQIKKISDLLAEKKCFRELCLFEQKTKQECKEYKKQMDDFRLTTHCASVDNLIDLQYLRAYESDTAAGRMHEVENRWLNRDEEVHTLNGLHEEKEKAYEREMKGYTYINWEKPFPFTKNIDVKKVCETLHAKATPLVNACIVQTHQEQNTSYLYYTDHSSWVNSTKNKEIELPYGATMECSTHIASKLALFHILQWDENIITGLTDISTLSERPSLHHSEQGTDTPIPSSDNFPNIVEDVPYEEIEQ